MEDIEEKNERGALNSPPPQSLAGFPLCIVFRYGEAASNAMRKIKLITSSAIFVVGVRKYEHITGL